MSGLGLRATECHHTIPDSVVLRQLDPLVKVVVVTLKTTRNISDFPQIIKLLK
jgi:hypothetical protein